MIQASNILPEVEQAIEEWFATIYQELIAPPQEESHEDDENLAF